MEHLDRARAGSFGSAAETYDRSRPSYPEGIVDLLVADHPGRALDVGCGTGKLARLLRARGVDVLGVEADPRMAEVARRHGVPVEVSRFEEWDPGDRTVQLVTSGQAWHWVDPVAGAARAAQVLRPGGWWAPVWNRPGPIEPEGLQVALAAAYAAHAPHLGPAEHLQRLGRDDPFQAAVVASGSFGPVERHEVGWVDHVDRDTYLARLTTFSNHWALPADQRARLLDGVGAAIDAHGGEVTQPVRAVALRARRR